MVSRMAVVELRRKQKNHVPWRVLLWSLVAALVGLWGLSGSPWEFTPTLELAKGEEVTREAQADVLLVIDYDAVRASPEGLARRDWSVAWLNLIEQEIGPVSVATPRSLSGKVLEDSRVVILTASVSAQVPDGLLKRLEEHVRRGNTLVVERPQGALRALFSADGRAGERRGLHITHARELPEAQVAELARMPLSTDIVGSTRALAGATTWLSVDGAPVIYSLPVGSGTVVTVDMDVGEQLVAMQQGRFTGDGEVVAAEVVARTSDLVMAQELVGEGAPLADLLERYIAQGVLAQIAGLPSFWYYPGGVKGLVVAVHEDSRLGDGGGWMLKHEATHKAVSSLLTTSNAGLTKEGAAAIHELGGDVGLLWRMQGTPEALAEPLGVAGFEPIRRWISPERQIAQLKGVLPVQYVRTSRVAGGWWSARWDEPLRALAAQKVRVDMSYATPQASGYAFGTGLPFLALGADGLPLPIRELPIVVPEGAVKGPKLGELLLASQAGHHMAITVSSDPASFADYPDMARFHEWADTFKQIEAAEHKLTSAYQLDNFLRSRRASSLQSRVVLGVPDPRVKPPEPAPDGEERKPAAPPPKLTVLRVTLEARTPGLWLMVPETLYGGAFDSARQRASRVGGELVSSELVSDQIVLMGMPRRRIGLERGFNTVDIYYRSEP
jgi:hypothetical protein